MADSKDLTLQDLAKIALGLQNFSETNIGILHSLIDTILKKLNCYDEKVVVTGVTCDHLLNLLCQAQVAPLTIPTETIPEFSKIEFSDRLSTLEKKVEELENTENPSFNKKTTNETSLKHIESSEDVYPVKGLMTDPVYGIIYDAIICTFKKKVIVIEQKLEELDLIFIPLLSRLVGKWEKSPNAEKCYQHLSAVSVLHRKHTSIIGETVLEIQDIMDSKANNYEISEMKKEFLQEFDRFQEKIEKKIREKTGFPVLLFGEEAPKKHNDLASKKEACECNGSRLRQRYYYA